VLDLFKSVFGTFNVQIQYLVWYLVIFGAVLWVLYRYAFQRVLTAVENRQAEINESLDRAEEAARSVDSSRARAEQILSEASQQSQEIVRRAEQAGNEIQERARADARSEAEAIVNRARGEVERERNAALTEIRKHAVDLALLAASRVIAQNLDEPRNRQLVEDTIRQADLSA